MSERCMDGCSLGALVLPGTEHDAVCANGMPASPASIRMLGRFSRLQEMHNNPHLCIHIAILRCTMVSNAAILISEHYKESLADLIEQERLLPGAHSSVAQQLASALCHLHSKRTVAALADADSVLVVPSVHSEDEVPFLRLSRYAINTLSDDGRDCSTLLGSLLTLPPERLLCPSSQPLATRKGDVWSYGCILLQVVTGITLRRLWTPHQYINVLQAAFRSAGSEDSLLPSIWQAMETASSTCLQEKKDHTLYSLIYECLQLRPRMRPSMAEVMRTYEKERDEESASHNSKRRKSSELEKLSMKKIADMVEAEDEDWLIKSLRLRDFFFLWTLSGSSAERILIQKDTIQLMSPVLTLPLLTVDDLHMLGNEEGRRFRATTEIITLPINNLREKLFSMDKTQLMHSFELDGNTPEGNEELPVIVKEKDVQYQTTRVSIISRLLDAFSFKPELLLESVKKDIPPMRRTLVWRSLLHVDSRAAEGFHLLDTAVPHPADRQLEVDIPRCHQYEELMTSPTCHLRLKRLLKAWLLSHPQYVYWQGLDSLAAPFLLLNFDNLGMAWACMSRFIDRYLCDFFLKDNSAVIQEYLAVFNHLVAYIDSSLYTCLADMDFFPELFAIPWFLTCFAHVLPLHKLFHLWDALLQADASFPLFIGVAVLQQLRHYLIGASFNDVILLFSDLPDLQIERILSDSIAFHKRTPRTCTSLSRGQHGIQSDMSRLTVAQLKSFSSPRLAATDFVHLVDQEVVTAIDLRPQNEFQRVSVIRSVNVPAFSALPKSNEGLGEQDENMALSTIGGLLQAAQRNLHPIVLYDGGRGEKLAKTMAAVLVRRGVNGVCILDGGFESIRGIQRILQTKSF